MLKEPYSFQRPAYQSIRYYTFRDQLEHEYMVQFAREPRNPQMVFMDLSVKDYDDEYSLTNAGDAYRIMSTVIHILIDFLESNPHVVSIRVTAVNEEGNLINRRMKLYLRYSGRVDFLKDWTVSTEADTIHLDKV